MTTHGPLAEAARHQCCRKSVFAQPRPKADIGAQNSNMLYVLLSGGTYSAERSSGKDGAVKSALNRREFNGLCGALCSFVASSGALALDAATAVASTGTAWTVKFRDGTIVPAIGQGSARIGQGRHPAAEEEEALRTGLSLGMTLIDTSGDYGEGRSEELIKRQWRRSPML